MTQTNRRWTWMVYMAGDNGKVFEQLKGGKRLMAPMEEQGYQDIQEMEAVGSTDTVFKPFADKVCCKVRGFISKYSSLGEWADKAPTHCVEAD